MPEMDQTVAEQMVKGLDEAGIDILFGIDDPPPLFEAIRRSSLRSVIVRDERSGAFMADGYSRARGGVAACTGITGPGATNLATGLLEAFCSSTPLLVVLAEAIGQSYGEKVFQAFDHERFFAPLCKRVVRLESPLSASACITSAAREARQGRPRPVAVLCDKELLGEIIPAGELADAQKIDNAGAAQTKFAGNPDDIETAWQMIIGARRPIVLAGNGVLLADAGEPLVRFAERCNIPVATSMLGKGAIAETHALALGVASAYNGGVHGHGKAVTELLVDADLIITVGSDLDPVTTNEGVWPSPNASVIRIDVDGGELPTVNGRRTLGIWGDAREVLEQLLAARGESWSPLDADWTSGAQSLTQQARAVSQAWDDARDNDRLVWPGLAVREISASLAAGDAIVTDASYSSAWALDRVEQAWPGRYVFAPRGSGVLGWGLPAALGVKLARPASRVVCITGDGGLGFSLGEFETAVRNSLDVTLVVLNNQCFGFQLHGGRLRFGQDFDDLKFADVNFAELARAFGWEGVRVERFADFPESLHEALNSGCASLIELMVDPEARPPLTRFDELLHEGHKLGV